MKLVSVMTSNETYIVKLKYDASYAPDVARVWPAELQDDLGCPVVAGGDDGGVMLPLEGGGPEVDQLDPGVSHPPDRLLTRTHELHRPVTRHHKQQVLGLQVGVGHLR